MKRIFCILLNTIVIAVSGIAQNNNRISGADSMHIIDLKEIYVQSIRKNIQQQLINFYKSNHASALEDILARLPEMSLIRRGSYGMEPAIRYFNGGQINVLVDGMTIHGACTDKMDPATIYIEPVNLENIQVQTSGKGFISGSTIGGTLNLKMTEPDYLYNKLLTGVINSGYQSAAKSFYESVRLNYSAGKWAFSGSSTYRHNNNYRSGGGEIVPFSQYRKVNYSLSAKYQQNKYTYIKIDLLADNGWNIGYAALPMDVGYAAARIGSVTWQKANEFNRLTRWQVKVYANQVKHAMDDTKRPAAVIHMDMPGESKTAGAYTEGDLKVNKKHQLFFRVDAASTFLKASMTMFQNNQPPMFMLTWPDNRKNQYGLSASWLWQVDSLVQLQFNSRMDYVSSQLTSTAAKDHIAILDNSFHGRVDFLKNLSATFSRKLSSRLKLNIGGGYSERIATASELFGFYLFNASDGYDYVGNPTLKLEGTLHTDLSFIYSYKRSRIQVNAYYSRVNNFITGFVNPAFSTMTIGAIGIKSYTNIPYALIRGAELSGTFKPNDAVDIVSTIHYSLATDDQKSPLPFVPPIKNINSIRYQPKRMFIQLETEASAAQNKISAKFGEDATSAYLLVHTRLGYSTSIFKSSVQFQGGIENIFDKKYHDHLDWGNINRPGRNYYIQFKVFLRTVKDYNQCCKK